MIGTRLVVAMLMDSAGDGNIDGSLQLAFLLHPK
jgi:hypothetical protein